MDFCIAVVMTIIKEALYERISDEKLFNALIEDVVIELELDKENEVYYLDKRSVSKIMTRNRNVPYTLRRALNKKPASWDGLEIYFSEYLIPLIIPEKMEGLCRKLTDVVKRYEDVSDMVLQELDKCIEEHNQIRLIAVIFRYSLIVPNRIERRVNTPNKRGAILDRNRPLDPIDYDGDDNLPCLREIVAAYRSKDGGEQNCTIEDFPKRKNHYQRQKEAFFAAEAVRHAVRDSFLDGENPFHDLLDEGYDGIIDTWERTYSDGLDRMEAVLDQASHISMESNPISRETAWVTTKVKKGLCHELVNEGRIEGWLYDEGV